MLAPRKWPRHYAAEIAALPAAEREAALARVPQDLRDWVAELIHEEVVLGPRRRRMRRRARVRMAAEIVRLPTRAERREALARVRRAARPAVAEIVQRLWARREHAVPAL